MEGVHGAGPMEAAHGRGTMEGVPWRGSHGRAYSHRERPRRELLAVVGPEEEDARGERVHVIVIVGRAGARGEVGGQLILEARDVLGNWQAWKLNRNQVRLGLPDRAVGLPNQRQVGLPTCNLASGFLSGDSNRASER